MPPSTLRRLTWFSGKRVSRRKEKEEGGRDETGRIETTAPPPPLTISFISLSLSRRIYLHSPPRALLHPFSRTAPNDIKKGEELFISYEGNTKGSFEMYEDHA